MKLTKLEHLDHVSLYLLTTILTIEHQTSLFYSQKSLLVLNVDQEIKQHSKTQESDVLEGDSKMQQDV